MKQALILIDFQNDYFVNGKMSLVAPEQALSKAQEVLEVFREKKLPIVHIQHVSLRADAAFFLPSTFGSEIHKEISPLDNEKLILKHYPNSFRGTELFAYLKSLEITHLVICGMMTHMCVDATTRAAKDLGFDVTLIADACATKDLAINGSSISAGEVQRSFLAALSYFYAAVKSVKQYLTTV